MLVDNALLMSNTNPAFYGRVTSLTMMGYGSQALLAPLWGILADTVGVRATLVIVGIATTVVTTFIGLSWQRNRPAMGAQTALLTSTAKADG
jgi:nitrate/nitrite transporter NarK